MKVASEMAELELEASGESCIEKLETRVGRPACDETDTRDNFGQEVTTDLFPIYILLDRSQGE